MPATTRASFYVYNDEADADALVEALVKAEKFFALLRIRTPMPGLEDLYREIILDHYRSPRNRGELPVAARARSPRASTRCAATRSSSTSTSTDGTVADVKIGGQGCSISQASTSMMSAAIKGKSVDEARKLIRAFKALMSIHESQARGRVRRRPICRPSSTASRLGDLEALQGVVKFPVRIKCATLAWNTLQQGLDEVAVACT